MREHKILYFSICRQHIEDFNSWAKNPATKKASHITIVDWIKDVDKDIIPSDLPNVISWQEDKDRLYVIIDYLSMVKGTVRDNNIDEYMENAAIVRRTILQYPEVVFLFDQSGVPSNWLSGIEFLLEDDGTERWASEVAQGFHIFRADDGFVLPTLDYDNIFDGTNLRWAIKKKYYSDLKLEVKDGNFANLQTARKDSLAIVIDDEPRQSRFNGFALYVAGYHVIPVNTARLLLLLNYCAKEGLLKPQVIIRDFDLQFPDVKEKGKEKDYELSENSDGQLSNEDKVTYKRVYKWDKNWNLKKETGALPDLSVDMKAFVGKKNDGISDIHPNMIDAVRNYRYFKTCDDAKCRWKIPEKGDDLSPFWSKELTEKIHEPKKEKKETPKEESTMTSFIQRITRQKEKLDIVEKKNEVEKEEPKKEEVPVYVVTNGHDMMRINQTQYTKWYVKNDKLNVNGIEKPVSGLYYPFFTKLKDENGDCIIKNHFLETRYGIKDGKGYAINKKREEHNHGVPIDVYDTVREMIYRAEKYYESGRLVKAAVLAQETIELLNGFHYQMMIKAYQIKTKAENAIAMDMVGADERQIVLDAVERIKIIKEDVRRMVYPLNKGEKHGLFADVIIQYHRRKKEHEILGHIFSDCRATCRDNEFFEVEDVFIREMAHIDQRAWGLEDVKRYCVHRIFMKNI